MAIELTLPSSPLQREILESPIVQGANETKQYYIDFVTWGASDAAPVTTPDVTVYDQDDVDVTTTVCSAGGSVVSDTLVYFILTALVAGNEYKVLVEGVYSSQTYETYFTVEGE